MYNIYIYIIYIYIYVYMYIHNALNVGVRHKKTITAPIELF